MIVKDKVSKTRPIISIKINRINMDVFENFIKENDGTLLYVVFGFQMCIVFIGFPFLLCQCSSPNKRAFLSYPMWMMKWSLVCYAGKWMLDSYDVLEIQMQEENTGVVSFDPYKLLHINNDGAFNTTAIYNSFDRLDVKYNPNVIRAKNSVQGAKKVPMDKAIKRYENLQKAFATLTREDLFSNYLKYGTPDGSKVIYALNLAVPYWILGEEMRPMLVTWAFVGCIVIGLGFKVW